MRISAIVKTDRSRPICTSFLKDRNSGDISRPEKQVQRPGIYSSGYTCFKIISPRSSHDQLRTRYRISFIGYNTNVSTFCTRGWKMRQRIRLALYLTSFKADWVCACTPYVPMVGGNTKSGLFFCDSDFAC